MATKWTARDIPSQKGRLAVVTGANSGIGLIAAQELARAGARVVLACRDTKKGDAAAKKIAGIAPEAQVQVTALDLASLDSVRGFAKDFLAGHDGLDLLINNAGVMAPPRRTTADGFELQFGTNHLGHFALTALLLEAMQARLPDGQGREDARIVTVSSGAHRFGKMNFEDLHGERRYFRWSAYGQSKLANLLFTFELDRRLSSAGSNVKAVAAHPGYSATHLQSAAAPQPDRFLMSISNAVWAQSAEMGALPTLYAATYPGLEGGTYVGPDGFMEQRGHPTVVEARPTAYNKADAARLWEISEDLTGVKFPLPAPAAAA
jgi:NAD(P)-dependent dehydrogenase (short-subunit alcohol dehydrogenase family)